MGVQIILNDCINSNTTPNHFVRFIKSASGVVNGLFVSNSNLYSGQQAIRVDLSVKDFYIKGNTIRCVAATAGLKFGHEATGLDVQGFTAYNAGTPYVPGDTCDHVGVAWENVNASTGSEPSKSNSDWKPAELYTGAIENNLIYRDTYAASSHGIFVGYGCYDVSIQNNIVSNFWYNMVFKGFNNTIRYNATGKGDIGMAFFANDQLLVANNTIRIEDGQGFIYGPNDAGGIGPMETTFRAWRY
jgi:hypothetical protein